MHCRRLFLTLTVLGVLAGICSLGEFGANNARRGSVHKGGDTPSRQCLERGNHDGILEAT